MEQNYNLLDVLQHTCLIIIKQAKYLALALAVNLLFFFGIYYYISIQTFYHTSSIIKEYFNQQTVMVLLAFMPLSFLVNIYLTLVIKKHYLKDQINFKLLIKETGKHIIPYMKGLFLLILLISSIIGISFTFLFFPLLNEISVLFCGFVIILMLGYFRFLPYTAVLLNDKKNYLKKTLHFMTGHLIGSVFILICFGLVDDLLSSTSTDSIIQFYSLRNIQSLLWMGFNFLIFQLINLFITITDITYITMGYMKK